MSESTRQKKYNRLLQRELGDIFQKDIKHMFGNSFITVTRVNVSPDLGVARVNLSIMLAESPEQMMELINSKKSEVRKILGDRIRNQVRMIPELVFNLDKGAEYASRIDEILSGLDIPPKEPSEDES